MKLRAAAALMGGFLLVGCTVPLERFDEMASRGELSPAHCRAYGVNVPDGAEPTGRVVHSEFGTFARMERECGVTYVQAPGAMESGSSPTGEITTISKRPPSMLVGGCAKQANVPYVHWPSVTGDYAIYYSEHKCIPFHEWCHATYETKQHTVAFNIRNMQGDYLASCPQ